LADRLAPQAFGGGDRAIQRLEAIKICFKQLCEALFFDDAGFESIVGVQPGPGASHVIEEQYFLGTHGLVGARQVVAHEVELAIGPVAVFRLADGSGFKGHESYLPPSR
jgi:hypothetical protein